VPHSATSLTSRRRLRPAALVSALALLCAVGFGVLPALVMASDGPGTPAPAFRVLLPAMAADSSSTGPQESPVVTQSTSTALAGGLAVYGEVHNGRPGPISGITVSGTVFSAEGAVLATRTVPALTPDLDSGATGLFRITFAGIGDEGVLVETAVAGYVPAAVTPIAAGLVVTVSGPRPLEIIKYDPVTHEPYVYVSPDVEVLDGRVTNLTDHALTHVHGFVAVYDGNGNVGLVADGSNITPPFPLPGEPVLQPGETGTFIAYVTIHDYLSVPGEVHLAGFVAASLTP